VNLTATCLFRAVRLDSAEGHHLAGCSLCALTRWSAPVIASPIADGTDHRVDVATTGKKTRRRPSLPNTIGPDALPKTVSNPFA
jgi:hypothetical protein